MQLHSVVHTRPGENENPKIKRLLRRVVTSRPEDVSSSCYTDPVKSETSAMVHVIIIMQ